MSTVSLDINTTTQDLIKHFGKNVEGKTYIITGPSANSLGAASAKTLASGGAKTLVLVGRSEERIQPVIEDISRQSPAVSVHFVKVDLLDLSSVRKGASEICTITHEIHGLLNCAGIMAYPDYKTSVDGIEAQFASNHVAHFLLTNLLLPTLAKSNGVVINVTSTAYELAEVNFEDPNFQGGETYHPWVAYAQSKTANILFSSALARKAAKAGVIAFAADPGLVVETSLQANGGVTKELFMKGHELQVQRSGGENPPLPTMVSINQGAAVITLPFFDPALREKSGAFLHECKIHPVKDYACDEGDADKLWVLSEKLVGQKFDI